MFKNIYIIFSRLFLNIITTFLYSRLLLNNLGTEGYGLYNVINSFIISLAIINTILITSTNRFIAIELGKKKSKITEVFNNIFSLHLLVAILILIIGEIIGYFWVFNFLNVDAEQLDLAFLIFNFSLFIAFFSIITVPFIAIQTANDDFKNQSNLSLLQSLLLLIIAYIIKYFENKLLIYSLISLIIFVTLNLYQITYSIKKYKFLNIKFSLNKNLLKDIVGYSGWMSIGAVAYMLKNQGNSILINLFFGTKLNASFGISNQVYQQVNGIVLNLNKVFVPKIMRLEGSGDKVQQNTIGVLSSRYLFFLGIIIATPIFINIDKFLEIWLINPPVYSAIFIKLFLLDMLLVLINNGISNMVFASGNVKKYQLVVNLTNLLNLPITYLLYNMGYEPYYLVLTSILFSLISNIYKIYFAKQILNISFNFLYQNNYKYILRISLISFVIIYILNEIKSDSWIYILISSFISSLILIFSILILGINKEEKKQFKNKIIKNEKFNILLFKIKNVFK